MRENRRHPDEEMLIVHKSSTKPDPDKVGRARGAAHAQNREELEHLKRRAAKTTDPTLKRELLLRIQREFGNDKAAEVLHELRLPGADDDVKGRPKPGRSDKGKA